MRPVRALWRVLRAALHVLHGALIVATRFHALDADERMARVGWWSRTFLRLLGLNLHSRGVPAPHGKLLVANHVSWLDILAINAVHPARFVSKSEVRHWPVIGRLVTAAGTLYIERDRRRDALRVVHQMAAALRAGDTLAVFPEGTTSDGHGLLPFHANLLQAALATHTPVQAVALRYSDPAHAVSPAAAYIGDTSLLQSFFQVVTADGLTVHLEFIEPQATQDAERREVAERLAGSIREVLAR